MANEVSGAVKALLEGGVVLVPTDTVYGLAVMPTAPNGVSRLFKIKGRPADINLPVMISDPSCLASLGVELTSAARAIFKSGFVPGPITVALGFSSDSRPNWLAGRHEVAVRVPNDVVMLEILRQTGPLLVTSANRHGQPTLQTVEEIVASLGSNPDFIIDDGVRKTVPSTLVNCRVSPPVVEREGFIPFSELLKIVDCVR